METGAKSVDRHPVFDEIKDSFQQSLNEMKECACVILEKTIKIGAEKKIMEEKPQPPEVTHSDVFTFEINDKLRQMRDLNKLLRESVNGLTSLVG